MLVYKSSFLLVSHGVVWLLWPATINSRIMSTGDLICLQVNSYCKFIFLEMHWWLDLETVAPVFSLDLSSLASLASWPTSWMYQLTRLLLKVSWETKNERKTSLKIRLYQERAWPSLPILRQFHACQSLPSGPSCSSSCYSVLGLVHSSQQRRQSSPSYRISSRTSGGRTESTVIY